MSFLTEAAARRMATVSKHFAVSTVPRSAFSSGIQRHKSAAEAAIHKLRSADRAVSDKLVDGLNIGCESQP